MRGESGKLCVHDLVCQMFALDVPDYGLQGMIVMVKHISACAEGKHVCCASSNKLDCVVCPALLSHMLVTAFLMHFPESGVAGFVLSFVALVSHWVVAFTLQASLDDYDPTQSAAARFMKATSV